MNWTVDKRRGILKMVIAVFAVLVLLAGGYRVGRWLETRNARPEPRGDVQVRLRCEPTIEVDGVSGSTVTSNAIKDALADCLSQAKI